MADNVDGARFWKLAADHCVEPLVYLCLARRAGEGPGLETLAAAKQRFDRAANRTLGYTRELHRVLELLERGGVRGVPYKGPLLAEVSYGNLLARSFHDLDIAVRDHDKTRARDLLLADGYRSKLTRSAEEEEIYLRDSHEYELVSADGRIALELHWRFAGRRHPLGVTPEDLWDRLERRQLMGREVWSFPPEALLCILAAHGSGHQWMRLDWIVCVAEHVRAHPALDWALVLESARAWRVLRATYVALALAAELLGAPVPAPVLTEARAEPSIPPLVEMIRGRLARGPGVANPPGEWWTYEMASRERLRDRWPSFRHQLRMAWLLAGSARAGGPAASGPRVWRFARLVAATGAPSLAWRLLRG